MESLPGGVEKPKIYMGLLVGTRGTTRSPNLPWHSPAWIGIYSRSWTCLSVCLGAPRGKGKVWFCVEGNHLNWGLF